MLGLLAAMFAGAFGKGPMSRKKAGQESLWVDYERFARWQTRTTLELHAVPDAADNKARISINDDYIKDVMIEQITPLPEHIETRSKKTTFIFSGKEREDPLVIRFHLQPEKPGAKKVRIALGEDRAIQIKQLVYP
jgi:hypothetical protein